KQNHSRHSKCSPDHALSFPSAPLHAPKKSLSKPDFSASCSWIFRWERGGRERWMGLGPLRTFSLPEARERARKVRQQLADGLDPLQTREEAKAAAARRLTFAQCAENYYEGNKDRWKNAKHAAQFIATLRTYAFPFVGNVAVADIDVGLILKVLEQKIDGTTFWKARPETASRVRSRIETVLSWATVRNYRSGDNPARWRGFLSTQLIPRAKKKPHPALPFEQLPAFMSDLRERTGVAARALEFLILTAARSGAVIGATWEEIDFKNRVWTVAPDRAGTKIFGDQPRRVPLSDRTVEILQELPRENGNPHVFIGPRTGTSISGAAMSAVIERMNQGQYVDPKQDNADIVVHGFRSCFKDWCSESTSYPNHVSEAALWHVVADKVEAAYRRGDLFEKRRRLMADWARYCDVVLMQEAAE
ncbi:MAG: site-specific integrase, partial [Pseudolabrys sp.]